MSDNCDSYKYQLSMKYGPGGIGMLNIRANTADEFIQNVKDAVASVGDAAVLMEAYNTEFQAVANLAGGGFQVQTQQPQQRPPFSGGASSGELCQHGSMIYRTGTSAKGPWSGWFCPADRNDPGKCKPKYNR